MLFKSMLDSHDFEFRFTCGVTQPTYGMKLGDKCTIISALCRHFTVYATVAEIDQMLQGLQTLQFGSLMRKHPLLLREVFKASEQKNYCRFYTGLF